MLHSHTGGIRRDRDSRGEETRGEEKKGEERRGKERKGEGRRGGLDQSLIHCLKYK